VTYRLMVMHIRTICPWTVLLDLFELFTLRSKVKVPWRSLRYATHRLMVIHPHTNYHWPTSKDKQVLVWTSEKAEEAEEAEEAEAEEKNQTKTICLPSFEGGT
jgi:hypothetical protein